MRPISPGWLRVWSSMLALAGRASGGGFLPVFGVRWHSVYTTTSLKIFCSGAI